MTRAPSRCASATEPSDEPLSAIKTSPAMPARARNDLAFATQVEIVSASLRQGIRMVSSRGDAIGPSSAARSYRGEFVIAIYRSAGRAHTMQVLRCIRPGKLLYVEFVIIIRP